MSEDEKDSDANPMNVDVSAKAEIKGEMPTPVVGRLGNALADVISPLTEGMGLVGDNIRLHREDLATKRIQGALDKINAQGLEVSPPPLKFLVPYLEKVSIQDEDNPTLNEMWENLLVTASTNQNSSHPAFINILSELIADDAQFLKRFPYEDFDQHFFTNIESFGNSHESAIEKMFLWLSYSEADQGFLLANETQLDEEKESLFSSLTQLDNRFIPLIIRLPKKIITNNDDITTEVIGYSESFIHSEQLVRQNLLLTGTLNIRTSNMSMLPKTGGCDIQITFAMLTHLGAQLLNACNFIESN